MATGWNTTTTASTTDRGYGHKWRKVRAQVLERDGHQCQPCVRADRLSRAHEVDHIKNKAAARAEGWTDEQIDDPSNLEAICTPCHKLKTSKENRQCRTA